MEFRIHTLKDLPVITHEDGSQILKFSDIRAWLRAKKMPNEIEMKSSNLLKWFKRNSQYIGDFEGQPVFDVNSLLKFCFSHIRTYQMCSTAANEIQTMLITSKGINSVQSVQDIYTAAAKADFLYKPLTVDILEDSIPTIHMQYKEMFSPEEWQRICLFEKHFTKKYNIRDIGSYSYVCLVEMKINYFKCLLNANNIALEIVKSSKFEIENRLRRKQLAEGEATIGLNGAKCHNPVILEVQLQNALSDQTLIEKIVCVDCTIICNHKPAIHVYVETTLTSSTTTTATQSYLKDICALIIKYVNRKHDENCASVTFFKHLTFKCYENQNGEVMRFKFRDIYNIGQLEDKLLYKWDNGDFLNDSTVSDQDKCYHCYGTDIVKPLEMKTFDVLTEWHIETPLICQIVFEKFLNRRSIKRVDNLDNLLRNKYTRFYGLYDVLLNIYNKKYHGILQEKQTKDLSLNFQSISSVFQVTSSVGLTQSLSTAERKLKQQSDCELTYYNTYLKKYPITYATTAGIHTKQINMRSCILILMMDNLVRLKYHNDPDPGEHRSMQICTLPITIKGLPKDSLETRSWHDSTCAELNDDCGCKKDRSLQTDQIDQYMLSLSADEQASLTRFRQLCCLGNRQMWNQIFEDQVHLISPALQQNNDMEISFASLHLDDEQVDSEDDIDFLRTEQTGTNCVNDIESFNPDFETDDNIENFQLGDIEFDDAECLSDDASDVQDCSYFGELIAGNDLSEISADSSTDKFDEGKVTDTSIIIEDDDSLLQYLGFAQYKPPPLLTRHPPPALGRDDDIQKLQEVLDDVLVKSDHNHKSAHKIIFGPDHKIASNLLKLQAINKKYKVFLPEFPLLHLRKSKITILCSAYKDAGILHILKYMRDEDFHEWKKLISAENIEMATKYIRRLAISLNIAFFCVFLQTLPNKDQVSVMDFDSRTIIEKYWKRFEMFLSDGRTNNGTFALHLDMLKHCEEVCAISLAEKLGGSKGYNLLLAAVKSSLPFSFLNGASSYAAFSVTLLHEHFRCGTYYQNMKHTLYTTPNKGSDINFALDTQREMDHKDALKAFRTGSTASAVVPRMSLLDSLNEIHETSQRQNNEKKTQEKLLGLTISETDIKYIMRIVRLVLRQGGISTMKNEKIYNVYNVDRPTLPETILDDKTLDIGKHLIQKYIAQSGMFGCSKSDLPDVKKVQGPKSLIQKLQISKGVTIRRVSSQFQTTDMKGRQQKEQQRQKLVKKETKKIDSLTSEMNACQAIVKPDCSKPKIQKAAGMKTALNNLLLKSLMQLLGTDEIDATTILEDRQLVFTSKKSLPVLLSNTVALAAVEFAGVKFKALSSSGTQYLKFVENGIIMKAKQQYSHLQRIIICEEKYSFTPDDFKAATRSQRKQKNDLTITHLKTKDEILSSDKFDKPTIITTSEGKQLISTFLARNIKKLKVSENLTVVVDSEYLMESCHSTSGSGKPFVYTTPISATFASSLLEPDIKLLTHIQQRKGEAEMAQIDWLMEYQQELKPDQSCVSIVTSGDIDAVVLHLFSIAHLWPRNNSDNFKNDVYVVLQKPGNTCDIYNITGILQLLETTWHDKHIGQKVALTLSLGGNDYMPKFHGISHNNTLEMFMEHVCFRNDLFKFEQSATGLKILFDIGVYKTFVKALYCPKSLIFTQLSYAEVRQISIQPTAFKSKSKIKLPQSWMPPETTIERLGRNVTCLIKYYLTVGIHDASLPNFLVDGCLVKMPDGEIEYNLGPEARTDNIENCFVLAPSEMKKKLRERRVVLSKKRKMDLTPQKGRRRKLKPVTSTPRKHGDEVDDEINI